LPEVDAHRCVHSHLEVATCRACVHGCPTDAWVIDDEQLGLDSNLCDGCGLCVAQCPEQALKLDQSISIRRDSKGLMAVVSCEKATTEQIESQLPCLNSISLSRILELYRSGVKRWIISTADCTSCLRYRGPSLENRIDQVNQILRENKIAEINLISLSWKQWVSVLIGTISDFVEADISRRGFFRKAFQTAGQQVLSSDIKNSSDLLVTNNQLLPVTDKAGRLFVVPIIDEEACNACGACIRVCQHQALMLLTEPSTHYKIEALNCTGCGLCEDVCEQDAVSVKTMVKAGKSKIKLSEQRCQSCGVVFYQLENHQSIARCPICRTVDHQKNLYQVLED